MSKVATRLLSLILMLQSRPTWKASELAAEFDVSVRTVHRYMRMLEDMGIPIFTERGPYGGFSLMRGYKLPPLLFTAEEATVLYMGAQLVRSLLGQTYDDAARAATAKLDNVLPDELRSEVARARQSMVVGGLTILDYHPWEETIHILRRCIGERKRVQITYRGFRHKESCRVIAPYALTLQWGYWYVVGFCYLRDEMRTFRVDRILDVVPQDETFSLPRGFDVREHMEQSMRFESAYAVVVQIDASAAPEVRERFGTWMQLEAQSDGSVIAQFEAATLDWATGWVLGRGSSAQALEPPELVARVREAALGVLERHGMPPPHAAA